jgi:acyl-CoA thioesterase FadM
MPGTFRSPRRPATARCQLTVRHDPCDLLGQVTTRWPLHDFEVARLEAMAAAGLPFAAILTPSYTAVASDLVVQDKAPAFAEGLPDLQCCIARYGEID